MSTDVHVYHSRTTPNAGWWIATVPTSTETFVVRRVLKDTPKTASDEAILTELARVVPEATGWTCDDRARLFTGKVRS